MKKTIKDLMEEFDFKFGALYDIGKPDLDNPDRGSENEHYKTLKAFLRTAIETAFEETRVEKASERNSGKISQTEILSYEQVIAWNLALIEVKKKQNEFLNL